MESISMVFFAILMVVAATALGVGVFVSDRHDRRIGGSLYFIAVLAFIGGMLGVLSKSDVIEISPAVIGVLTTAVFVVGASLVALVASVIRREKIAAGLAMAIFLGSGAFVGIMSAEIGYDNRVDEISSACQRSGTSENICDRFAEKFDSRDIAKNIFSRYDGSPDEARIMLTGKPLSKEDCNGMIRGLQDSDLSLKEALDNASSVRTINRNSLYENWCQAVEHATKDNNVSEYSIEDIGIIGNCKRETANYAVCGIGQTESKGVV